MKNQVEKIHVMVKKGCVLRNPVTMQAVPHDHTMCVPKNAFWLRRIKAKDCFISPEKAKPIPAKVATKAKPKADYKEDK